MKTGELKIATREQTPPTSAELLKLVEQSLGDDKAEEVVVIDIEGKSSIADYLVVASGNSPRHVGAIAEHLREKMKKLGIQGVSVEGQAQGDWVLLDGGDIVVHLFRPEVRAFYNLEKIWGITTEGQADSSE